MHTVHTSRFGILGRMNEHPGQFVTLRKKEIESYSAVRWDDFGYHVRYFKENSPAVFAAQGIV